MDKLIKKKVLSAHYEKSDASAGSTENNSTAVEVWNMMEMSMDVQNTIMVQDSQPDPEAYCQSNDIVILGENGQESAKDNSILKEFFLNENFENFISKEKNNLVKSTVCKRTNQPRKKGQKRKLDEASHIDVKSKLARQSGIGGIGRKGIIVKERKMGPGCTNCRKKCHLKLSIEDRLHAKSIFWGLKDHSKQWQCLINWKRRGTKESMSDKESSSSSPKKKRKKGGVHLLPKKNTKKLVLVCKKMFLDTLDISDQFIRTAERKFKESNFTQIIFDDQRGRHQNRPRKYPECLKELIRFHIGLFPLEATDKGNKFADKDLNGFKLAQMLQEEMKIYIPHQLYCSILSTEYDITKPKETSKQMQRATETSEQQSLQFNFYINDLNNPEEIIEHKVNAIDENVQDEIQAKVEYTSYSNTGDQNEQPIINTVAEICQPATNAVDENVQYEMNTFHESVPLSISQCAFSSAEDSNCVKKKEKLTSTVCKRITQPDKKGKKRQLDKSSHIDVKSKLARQSGVGGIGRKGVIVKERKMGPGCNKKCSKECHQKFSEENRKYVKDLFWGLRDHSKQWQCLLNWRQRDIKEELNDDESSSPSPKRKRKSRGDYLLPNRETGELVIVCKNMFLDTLAISDQWIRTADKKLSESNETQIIINDQRGKHANRPRKYPDALKTLIRYHINLFPVVQVSDSKKKFLDGSLSIRKMTNMLQDEMKMFIPNQLYYSILVKEFKYEFLKANP